MQNIKCEGGERWRGGGGEENALALSLYLLRLQFRFFFYAAIAIADHAWCVDNGGVGTCDFLLSCIPHDKHGHPCAHIYTQKFIFI